MPVWTTWLIIAGFFAILEIATVGFLVIWIGIGALPAMIYSMFFPEQVLVQVAIWVVCSIVLILLTKNLTDKIKPTPTNTNVYSIIGKRATVIQDIDAEKSSGQIKVGGDVWSAKAENYDDVIPEGTSVEIVSIEGVKAVVKKLVEESTVEAKN
ncbi:MAG: NfeD family protein [Clostridia bacterium]|nr:NfeD family protein [Clostridia bacterium]